MPGVPLSSDTGQLSQESPGTQPPYQLHHTTHLDSDMTLWSDALVIDLCYLSHLVKHSPPLASVYKLYHKSYL